MLTDEWEAGRKLEDADSETEFSTFLIQKLKNGNVENVHAVAALRGLSTSYSEDSLSVAFARAKKYVDVMDHKMDAGIGKNTQNFDNEIILVNGTPHTVSEIWDPALKSDESWKAVFDGNEKIWQVQGRGEPSRVEVRETKNAVSTWVSVAGAQFVDVYGSWANEAWSKNQTSDLVGKNAALYQKYYLGAITESVAQERCRTRTQWFIYHRVDYPISAAASVHSPHGGYPTHSQLFIVYRRSDGTHEHYKIQTKSFKTPDRHAVFYADYGDPGAPRFASIYGLLNFYDNFGHVKVVDTHHCQIEVFPLWKRACVRTISEYSSISSDDSEGWQAGDSFFDSTGSTSAMSASEASVTSSAYEPFDINNLLLATRPEYKQRGKPAKFGYGGAYERVSFNMTSASASGASTTQTSASNSSMSGQSSDEANCEM